jgi:small subunit ribosomal protein S2
VIPGNDDAIRSIRLFTSRIADACIEGRQIYEEKMQAQADGDQEKEMDKGDQKVAIEVVSDGTDGPVVEKIKRKTTPAEPAEESIETE